MSLAAYVAEDGLVCHHWEERPLGLANFICKYSTGERQGQKNGNGWVGKWGAFVQTVVDFLIIAFCIFMAIKFINKLRKPAPEPETAKPVAPAPPTQEELLTEIRDLLRRDLESKK